MRVTKVIGLMLVMLGALGQAACYATAMQPRMDTRSRIISTRNSVVRLKVKNRVPFDMRNPRVEGDSVIGIDNLLKSRVAIRMSDVEWADVSQGGAGGVVAVATLILVGVLAVMYSLLSTQLSQ